MKRNSNFIYLTACVIIGLMLSIVYTAGEMSAEDD